MRDMRHATTSVMQAPLRDKRRIGNAAFVPIESWECARPKPRKL